MGFSRMLAGKTPPYLGGPSMSSMFGGFQGLPTTPNLTGGLNTQTITGLTAMGRQTSNPQFQNPTSWDPKLNFSKTMGRHSLKMGYQYLNIRTEILDTNPLYGQDTYSGAFSKPTCAQLGQPSTCTVPADSTSYNLADFMFGTPNQINLGSYTVVNLRQFVHSLYVQDDYRVSAKLTLNVGLRWEFASPLYERDNNYSNFDPTTNTHDQGYQREPVPTRPGPPRLQRLWAAPRPGVQHRSEDGGPRADTGSATRSSTGREAPRRGSTLRRRFSACSARRSPRAARCRPHSSRP